MSKSKSILIERWDGAAYRLVLNRPEKGNALSRELVQALDDALQRCEQRQASLLVIEGMGAHFCSGFDLSDIASETDDSLLARFTRIELMLQRLARAPFCTVAVAHGRVTGAGADLFAACAVRLVQGDAVFAFPGATGFGLVLGSRRLAGLVGQGTATRWVTSGGAISAGEAVQSGLASAQLADPAAVQAAIDAAGTRVADSKLYQQLSRALRGPDVGDDAHDLEMLVRSAARPGLQARVAAYVARKTAKRPPVQSA